MTTRRPQPVSRSASSWTSSSSVTTSKRSRAALRSTDDAYDRVPARHDARRHREVRRPRRTCCRARARARARTRLHLQARWRLRSGHDRRRVDPVGILDVNQDGAADDTRFIAGAVGIKCGAIDVPIDLDNSYWNPSGDQNEPAMGGFDALGPAIVLAPRRRAADEPRVPALSFAPTSSTSRASQSARRPSGDVTKPAARRATSARSRSRSSRSRHEPELPTDNDTASSHDGADHDRRDRADRGRHASTADHGDARRGTPVTGVTVTLPQPTSIRHRRRRAGARRDDDVHVHDHRRR